LEAGRKFSFEIEKHEYPIIVWNDLSTISCFWRIFLVSGYFQIGLGCFLLLRKSDGPKLFVHSCRMPAQCRLPISCLAEGMGTNQLCRIAVGISSQIGRDGHRDMGDVSTYGKNIRNLLGSMKPLGSTLCADTRRYKYLRDLRD